MSVNNRALALADELEDSPDEVTHINAASTIRFLVSFNQQLMDKVTRLQKREWVGLTDEEIEELWGSPIEQEAFPELHFKWVRTIEAKFKEKNT